jgi:hypothetical protein
MTKTVIKLSTGDKIEVRRLGIFELDVLDPDPLGPFTYTGQTLAGEVEIEYDGSGWEEPPPRPELDGDPEPRSDEWMELREYEMYHAWIRHESKRMEAAASYHEQVAEYILSNCVNGGRDKIITDEDWAKIHLAALVPQLTQEDVADALRNTFQSEV